MEVLLSLQHPVFISFGNILIIGVGDHIADLILTFQQTFILFFIMCHFLVGGLDLCDHEKFSVITFFLDSHYHDYITIKTLTDGIQKTVIII